MPNPLDGGCEPEITVTPASGHRYLVLTKHVGASAETKSIWLTPDEAKQVAEMLLREIEAQPSNQVAHFRETMVPSGRIFRG